ncbi:13182_t:CDS:1 [Acaulospora colombiana]|uniref:13182_t:CDS:1 n=1 Tax=Acaulospora colombiana TaxID=27376 RepID=A0ACA9L104_9GLOM|nr:13182_t:CDS:1 [Acaulospora colombiana]
MTFDFSLLNLLRRKKKNDTSDDIENNPEDIKQQIKEKDDCINNLRQNLDRLKEDYDELMEKGKSEEKRWERERRELINEKEQELFEKEEKWNSEREKFILERKQNVQCDKEKLEKEEQWNKEIQKLIEEKERWNEEKQELTRKWNEERQELMKQQDKERQKWREEKGQWDKDRQKWNGEKGMIESRVQKSVNKERQEKQKLIREKEQQRREHEQELAKQAEQWKKEKEQWKKVNQELIKEKERWESVRQNLNAELENRNRHIENLEKHGENIIKRYEQKLQVARETYKKNVDTLNQKLDKEGNGLRELEEENAKLRKEASKYQSALGVATNIRLSDNDQNHSVQLKRDIENLQTTFENYVTHLKPNMDINIEKVQALAKDYGYPNEITKENLDKPLIKAMLQLKIWNFILHYFIKSREYRGANWNLETDIDAKAQDLLRSIATLSETRDGTDKVTGATIIKIRQQVYGILGSRGFNYTVHSESSEILEHNFVSVVSEELNKMINEYRKINDADKRTQVESMAPKLVREASKLFLFRMKVQEPMLEYYFFPKGDIIDANSMEGKWDDDEVDHLRVGICYFPMLGSNLKSKDQKIYTPARIFPQKISCNSET